MKISYYFFRYGLTTKWGQPYLLVFFLNLLFWLNLAAQEAISQSGNDNKFYVSGQDYQLMYTGQARDFKVPAEAVGKYLFLEARGADGGRINYKTGSYKPGPGGQGATVSGYFKIGTAINEIPVGATIRVVVGSAGEGHTNTGQIGKHSGGGGGGTGVIMLPGNLTPENADPEDWKILLVGGGGGGGHSKFDAIYKVPGLPGNDQESASGRPIDAAQYGSCSKVTSSTLQLGGTDNGGGGTAYQLYSHLCSSTLGDWKFPAGNALLIDENPDHGRYTEGGGYGGFQKGANEKMQPLGGRGGTCDILTPCLKGGFGFGGGGAGFGGRPGGGGGYSGAAPGYLEDHYYAGGGGSYVNHTYILLPTALKIKNGNTLNPGNGWIKYRFSDKPVIHALDKDFSYSQNQARYLLQSGAYTLAWQGDGNLVLYQSGQARWASGTNGKGELLSFQDDGNLVIYGSGRAIWSSKTPDNWNGGKGGDRLMLCENGNLAVVNVDNKVLWQIR